MAASQECIVILMCLQAITAFGAFLRSKQEGDHNNMSSTTKPKVSIIIPSWTGEVSRLMRSIEQQTFRDYEVDVVQRISPLARARNLGAQRARADILLFVDDDITLGHEHVLQKMVDLLDSDAQIAIV